MFDNNVYVLCRKKLVGNMLITIGMYHKIFRNRDDAIAEMKSVKSLRDYHIMRSFIAGDADVKKAYIFTYKCIAGFWNPETADRLHFDCHFHSNPNMTRLRMQVDAENNGLSIYRHTADFNRMSAKSSTKVWAYRLRSFDVV